MSSKNKDNQKPSQKQESPKKNYWRVLWKIGIGLFLFFGLLAALTFWSRLSLKVYMSQTELDFNEKIEVRAEQSSTDVDLKIIPGKTFVAQKKKWQVFQTTGEVTEQGEAKGEITIINNSQTGVTLREGTRFLSSEQGKIFKIQEKVYVPAAKTDSTGSSIAGKVDVEVAAQEGGEDYNIGPATFSIPGLAGTDLFYEMHGESTESMQGGFKKHSQTITEEDLNKAKQVLEQEIEQAAKEDLIQQTGGEFVFVDGALLQKDFSATCFEKAGTVAAEFNCEGEITAKWLCFKLSDAKEIALAFIASRLSSVEEALPETLEMSFSSEALIAETEKMILSANIKVGTFIPLNENIFLSRIAGESQEEIQKIILQNYPYVRNIEMNFWPFWIRKAPGNIEDIKVEVEFVD